MLELIWRFDLAPLDDESVMRPLLSALAGVPGFDPVTYDLNQKEQWRPLELERAVVDALTQRTQLVRLANADRDQIALIALGKHDEQPTAIVRLAEDDHTDLAPLVADWADLYESLPLESTIISSSRWRRALLEADLSRELTGDLLGMVFGWRRGAETTGFARIVAEVDFEGPVRLEREANHIVLWLARAAHLEGPAHRRTLEGVARVLSKSSG